MSEPNVIPLTPEWREYEAAAEQFSNARGKAERDVARARWDAAKAAMDRRIVTPTVEALDVDRWKRAQERVIATTSYDANHVYVLSDAVLRAYAELA